MISLIVVDYKSIEKTCCFLEEAAKRLGCGNGLHYLIVDNDPDSAAASFLKGKYPVIRETVFTDVPVSFYQAGYGEICYLFAGKNLGYAKGNNLGALAADQFYQDEYYLICNNDLRFESNWNPAEVIRVFREQPKIAVIGPKIIGLDRKEQNPYRKRSPYYWLFVYPWSRFWPIKSRGDYCRMAASGECYRVMGCMMFLRADSFRACGRFDEHTFLFSEEMILSEKMQTHEYTCYYDNRFCAVHEHAKTIRSTTKAVQVEKWFFDSMFYYCRKYRKVPAVVMVPAWINRGLNLAAVAVKEKAKQLIGFQKSREHTEKKP